MPIKIVRYAEAFSWHLYLIYTSFIAKFDPLTLKMESRKNGICCLGALVTGILSGF